MGDRLGYLQHGLDAATAIGDIAVSYTHLRAHETN